MIDIEMKLNIPVHSQMGLQKSNYSGIFIRPPLRYKPVHVLQEDKLISKENRKSVMEVSLNSTKILHMSQMTQFFFSLMVPVLT
jgi:hypothetical protein